MGNKIPRTETIETNDDNGTKGGVEDTADDRGNDRVRYGENKCFAGMRIRRQSLQKPSIVNKERSPAIFRQDILSCRLVIWEKM